ncbi:MAG: L-threonylcarbamoyladenylate synthase [Chthoniobacterales bacterium]
MTTEVVSAEEQSAIDRAVAALQAGEAIGLPTETVYGLAADALNTDAVLKIFEAKERPRFDPLIVHLPDAGWLDRLTDPSPVSKTLIASLTSSFWPGPLTLVLPRQAAVSDIVAAGLGTVAVRMSAHPVFQRVVESFGRPLAAPSANRFGRISPTTAEHVRSELDGRVPLIVDGGPTLHGLESTIVAVRAGHIEILRHGPVTAEELGAFADVRPAQLFAHPEAPGQLASHYAPRTPLVLCTKLSDFALPAGTRAGALAFGPFTRTGFTEVRTLSPDSDLREAAANLFRGLRELDQLELDLIVAEEVPETGLGRAIMDRLRRAAALGGG